jgi:hypothetical protein
VLENQLALSRFGLVAGLSELTVCKVRHLKRVALVASIVLRDERSNGLVLAT